MCSIIKQKGKGAKMPTIECVTDENEVRDCFTDCNPVDGCNPEDCNNEDCNPAE